MKMMTAKEAKNNAISVINAKVDNELSIVFTEIKRKSDMGEYSTYFEGDLMEVTKNKLIELDFKVKSNSHMNETTTSVSWA